MRCVVITGGSRGIGAAAVRRFAAAGDQVYFLYEKARNWRGSWSRRPVPSGFPVTYPRRQR